MFNDLPLILAYVIYRRDRSLEYVEEKIKQSIDENQRVDGNARNHEGKITIQPPEKNNITYQGMNRQTPGLVKNSKITRQYLSTVWMQNTNVI